VEYLVGLSEVEQKGKLKMGAATTAETSSMDKTKAITLLRANSCCQPFKNCFDILFASSFVFVKTRLFNCAVDTAHRKAMNGLCAEGSCPDLFLRQHGNNQVGVAKKRTANGALRDVVRTLHRGVL
jgi:hypothetical protein